MKRFFCVLGLLLLSCSFATAQAPEVKFIADTLVVQADGTYEADPDLATMTFQIFSQDKDIKHAYAAATQSMQRIVDLGGQNGLKKEDVTTGVLTVAPVYEGDRKKRARSYYVQGNVVLRIRDFSRIGPILDGSVEDGVADSVHWPTRWPTRKPPRSRRWLRPCVALWDVRRLRLSRRDRNSVPCAT